MSEKYSVILGLYHPVHEVLYRWSSYAFMTSTTRRPLIPNIESILWLILLSFYAMQVKQSSAMNIIWIISFRIFWLLSTFQMSSTIKVTWRIPSSASEGDAQGIIMSAVLPPLVMLVMQEPAPFAASSALDFPANVVVLAVSAVYYIEMQSLETLCYAIYSIVVNYYPLAGCSSLQGVFTKGEFKLVSTIGGITLIRGLLWIPTDPEDVYLLVAVAGVTGTLLGCKVASLLSNSLITRLPFLMGMPLLLVELNLYKMDSQRLPKPLCLYWLVDFLLQVEGTCPRYYFLIYWALVLAVFLPLSPSNFKFPVIARKWFHGIAILLFLPPTYDDPMFMSLVYAIAMCVLVVIEHVRRMTPFNCVYIRYLDVDKDTAEKVVISPITLIAGCAIPCWMSAIMGIDRTNGLALFGILVLGVGDSMAAIVGTHYGKTKWGRKRSVEGSFAMLMSMFAICWACGREDWTIAVIVSTILEALTCQTDNLVLPLTGATVVMIQSRWAASYNQMDNLVLLLITVGIAVAVIDMLLNNYHNASNHLFKVCSKRLEDLVLNKQKDFTCKDMFISNIPRVSTDESEASNDLMLQPCGIKLNEIIIKMLPIICPN